MKMAGCKTEKEFYAKYPSENAFFSQFPHMKGNQTMKNGGAASGHEGSYWNGDSWVSTAGDSGTYASGVYYANGGPTFMPGGGAPVFANGGVASFNVSNNEYPTPFAMYPGTGNGSGYLQDLPTQMAFGGITPGAQIVNPFAMDPGPGTGSGMLQDLPVEMKRGGKHHKGGKKKHLTPQQLQIMMQAMSQAQGQPQGQGMPQGMPQGAMMSSQDPNQQMMSPQDQQMMAMQQAQQGQQQQMSPQDQQMMMQQQQMQQQQMQQQGGGQPMPGMKQGGIHIKKSHEGLFTKKANAAGMGVQEYAHHVMAHSNNPTTRKQANFAIQAAKWKHEYGGSTMMEMGGTPMPNNPGFRALPPAIQQKIMNNMQTGGMITADRMVYQPGGEYQQGGNTNEYATMAMGQMSQMQHKLGELGKVLNQGTQLEPWVASKMTLANDYLNSVENYLEHNPEARQQAYGGMVNPFHPLARFARGGYYQEGGSGPKTSYNETDDMSDPLMDGSGVSAPQTVNPTGPSGVVSQEPAAWTQGMTGQQPEDNINYGEGSTQAYDPTTGNTTQEQYDAVDEQKRKDARAQKWQNRANWGNAILGTGMAALGVAGTLADKRDQRNLRNKQFNDRMSSNAFATMNQPGGHGDYVPNTGAFRPDQQTPTAAGMFYPGGGAGVSKYGGGVMNNYTYAHGGYHAGQELELSDAEIANLKRMGYKFDII